MIPNLLSHKRILVVEDDPYNLAITRVYLRGSGAYVEYERWGLVQGKLIQYRPDIVLLDLMITADVSGYDVFDLIRATEGFTQIPILAVTAADPAIEMPRVRTKGFNGYIAKPLSFHFTQHIRDALNGKPVWISSGDDFSGV